MKIGIIGYGSMGKMLLEKFCRTDNELFVSNRTLSKIESSDKYVICDSNAELARLSDIIFICVRPGDILGVLSGIVDTASSDALIISLNGSIRFESLEELSLRKYAKVIPSVTAEIDRSQTLVTYHSRVTDEDKKSLTSLLSCIGNVIELPEDEMGMGSELVSCMPGFIASMFDVVSKSARKHTSIPDDQIVDMLLNTLSSTADLMLQKDMSFEDVVSRVATKGGITETGTRVIYDSFPETCDEMFEKTLAKRRQTASFKLFEKGPDLG